MARVKSFIKGIIYLFIRHETRKQRIISTIILEFLLILIKIFFFSPNDIIVDVNNM